ncbi:hypothetical protein Tco_0679052 [Tanacetum coccineum]|uniref:Reverse transcriptase domain-containing protein n=1 Tax=Tanacetum coccineum TaxID=301880 RepID=A0ABQ4XHR1_9ASTR
MYRKASTAAKNVGMSVDPPLPAAVEMIEMKAREIKVRQAMEGKEGPHGLEEPMSDEVLREMCDKNYHKLLPLIAEKMQKEKEQKDKLNAVKARLIYGEEYSRSPSPHASVFKRLKKYRSPSPRLRPRKEGGVFNRLGRKEPATSARPDSRQRSPQAKRTEVEARRRQQKGTPSRTTSQYSESEDMNGFHWKSNQEGKDTNTYEDISTQLWTWKTISANKAHQGHPLEIHHIKHKDGESTEDFMERYKAEVLDVEGAPECMRISGFMHGITYPGLIKRLYERIQRSMDEMYKNDLRPFPTRGKLLALVHRPEKIISTWKPSEGGNKPEFKKELQKQTYTRIR